MRHWRTLEPTCADFNMIKPEEEKQACSQVEDEIQY